MATARIWYVPYGVPGGGVHTTRYGAAFSAAPRFVQPPPDALHANCTCAMSPSVLVASTVMLVSNLVLSAGCSIFIDGGCASIGSSVAGADGALTLPARSIA